MKKKILFIGILFLAMSFVACTKQDNIEKEKESTNTEQNMEENKMENNDKTEQLYKKEDVPQPKYNGSYFKPDEVAYAEEIEAIKKHLKEKYDQDFEFIGVNGAAFMKSFDEWWFRPVGLNSDVEVEMIGNYDENGEYYTKDNYFRYIIKDEAVEFVNNIVKDEFKKYKVGIPLNSSLTVPDKLVKGTPLLDIHKYENEKDGYYRPIVFIMTEYSDEYNYKKHLERMLDKLSKNKFRCYIELYVIDENKFDELEKEDLSSLRANKTDIVNILEGQVYGEYKVSVKEVK